MRLAISSLVACMFGVAFGTWLAGTEAKPAKEVVTPITLPTPEPINQHDDRLPPWLMQHPLYIHESQCPGAYIKHRADTDPWKVHCLGIKDAEKK